MRSKISEGAMRRLRRRAKSLSTERGTPLHEAQQAIAVEAGYSDWRELVANSGQERTPVGKGGATEEDRSSSMKDETKVRPVDIKEQSIRENWIKFFEMEDKRDVPNDLKDGFTATEQYRIKSELSRISNVAGTESAHLCRYGGERKTLAIRCGDLFMVWSPALSEFSVFITPMADQVWKAMRVPGERNKGLFSDSHSAWTAGSSSLAKIVGIDDSGPWWAALREHLPSIIIEWREARKKELAEDAKKLTFKMA